MLWTVRPWGVPSPVVTNSPVVSADTLAALARSVLEIGAESGLAAVGIAGAEPFHDTRATLEARRDAGLHGGMQFTYRNPGRSTDPDRILSGARSLVVGARGYLRQELPDQDCADQQRGPGPGPRRPAGSIARYARHDHYGALRAGLDRIADRIVADGWRARVVVDDNALVDRAAAQRAGLGWFGRNTLLLLPGGMWHLPALHHGMPHRCPGRRRRPGRPALPGLARPGAGHLPRGVPFRPGFPDLRVRRLPAGLPGQPDGGAAAGAARP